MDPLLLRAGIAASVFAAAAAPLGAFVVWRRMAYFGEALSHSVLLGVALGVVLDLDPARLLLPFLVLFALALAGLERRTVIPRDTLLGILAHGALAAGVLLIAATGAYRASLLAYLFGDVLAVDAADVALLAVLAVLVGVMLLAHWQGLVSWTVSAELAAVEGVPVVRLRLLLVGLLALVVAMGMRVVGMLLVMALLIVPAATVRPWSRSPEAMAAGAIVAAILAVVLGLGVSWQWDLPPGPAIAAAAVALFFAGLAAAEVARSGGWSVER